MSIDTTSTAALRHIATFRSSTTWTCPQGITKIWVTVFGASSGGNNQYNGVMGYGGAGCIGGAWVNVAPGHTYPIIIGAAGAIGFTGGAGGITYFDGAIVANAGGNAGQGYSGATGQMVYQTTLPDTYPANAEARVSGAVTSNTTIPGTLPQNSFTANAWGTTSAGRVEIYAV